MSWLHRVSWHVGVGRDLQIWHARRTLGEPESRRRMVPAAPLQHLVRGMHRVATRVRRKYLQCALRVLRYAMLFLRIGIICLASSSSRCIPNCLGSSVARVAGFCLCLPFVSPTESASNYCFLSTRSPAGSTKRWPLICGSGRGRRPATIRESSRRRLLKKGVR